MCAFEICTDECGKTAKQSAYLILCVKQAVAESY